MALESGRDFALVTITAVLGSTPGKVGDKMLVYGHGQGIAGTVGGGRVEARMIEQAAKMLSAPACRLFRFDLGKTPDDEDGICGGSVEFLIETFDQTALSFFHEVAAIADHDGGGVLISLVSAAGVPRKIHLAQENQTKALSGLGLASSFSQEIEAAAKKVAAPGSAGMKVSTDDMQAFVEPLAKSPTVILCGAGHVAYHIARYARSVHFRVVVCDERPEYANRERFPDADSIITEDFTQIFDRIPVDDHSYVVIVARGHQCDETVLERAVRTDAHYIGMIGSRQKTRIVLQNLRDKGIPQKLLDRVYAPIGVSIGAVSAEEIALSIVCELVKVRRLGDAAHIGHMTLSTREGVLSKI
ncbi:MAG: XdhC family protein [Pirellulaceae bacterium]